MPGTGLALTARFSVVLLPTDGLAKKKKKKKSIRQDHFMTGDSLKQNKTTLIVTEHRQNANIVQNKTDQTSFRQAW